MRLETTGFEMRWHQLDRMQTICTSLQTDNHTNTSSLNFHRPDALPDTQPTVSKHWRLLSYSVLAKVKYISTFKTKRNHTKLYMLTIGPRPNSSGKSGNLRMMFDLNSSCDLVFILSKTTNQRHAIQNWAKSMLVFTNVTRVHQAQLSLRHYTKCSILYL